MKDDGVDWYFMRPCVGIPQLNVPPLCKYHETMDGTYTLADIERFHITLDKMKEWVTNA